MLAGAQPQPHQFVAPPIIVTGDRGMNMGRNGILCRCVWWNASDDIPNLIYMIYNYDHLTSYRVLMLPLDYLASGPLLKTSFTLT